MCTCTFHFVSSCAVPAVDSCVMFATRLYIVVNDGSSGGFSIPEYQTNTGRSATRVLKAKRIQEDTYILACLRLLKGN